MCTLVFSILRVFAVSSIYLSILVFIFHKVFTSDAVHFSLLAFRLRIITGLIAANASPALAYDCARMYTLRLASAGVGVGNKLIFTKPPSWASDAPLTRGQLLSKRDDFWDISPSYGGKLEIWQVSPAPRRSCLPFPTGPRTFNLPASALPQRAPSSGAGAARGGGDRGRGDGAGHHGRRQCHVRPSRCPAASLERLPPRAPRVATLASPASRLLPPTAPATRPSPAPPSPPHP